MPNGTEPRTDWLVRFVILSLYGVLLAGWIVAAVIEGMHRYDTYERRHTKALNEQIEHLRIHCPSEIADLAVQHAYDVSRVKLEPRFSRWRVELQDKYEIALRFWEKRRAGGTRLVLSDPHPSSPEETIARCVSKISLVANFRFNSGYDPVGRVLGYLSELLLFAILAATIGLAAFKVIDWHHRTHSLVQRKWQRALVISVPLWWVILLLAAQPEGLMWGPTFLTWGLMVPAIGYVLAWLFMQHLLPWISKGHSS